jgi:hypothetical protein
LLWSKYSADFTELFELLYWFSTSYPIPPPFMGSLEVGLSIDSNFSGIWALLTKGGNMLLLPTQTFIWGGLQIHEIPLLDHPIGFHAVHREIVANMVGLVKNNGKASALNMQQHRIVNKKQQIITEDLAQNSVWECNSIEFMYNIFWTHPDKTPRLWSAIRCGMAARPPICSPHNVRNKA